MMQGSCFGAAGQSTRYGECNCKGCASCEVAGQARAKGKGAHLSTGCMYEGIPVLHVGQHGVQGPHIQVGRLCQGEASADGPVIHCPLPAVEPTS